MLLVTLDTTRADALGAYGRSPSVTPRLDAFARESTTYVWARTVTPTTLPAHASMLTGLYPNRHTVRDNSLNALPASAETLAERARAADFRTAAFVSAKVLDRAFGLDQGFTQYSQPPREKEVVDNPTFSSRPARETAAEFAAWLAELSADQSFFAWVHFFDAHAPWTAGEPWTTRAGGHPYLAEIAAQDDAFGSLLEALQAQARLADTTVLVIGDHGEGLGDHGEATHAYFVFDSTLRVPFLLRRADGRRAGERSTELVSAVDVLPTLNDALGLGEPRELDGRSLWNAPVPADRGVYFESYYGFLHYGMAPLAGWVDSEAKYVHSSKTELYHPKRSPLERKDLSGELDVDVARYRARIAEQEAKPALQRNHELKLDPALLRDVQALGYAGSLGAAGELPSALAASALPSPHERAEELQRCERAHEHFRAGRVGDAARILRTVLEGNPGNSFALEYLAFSELALGNLPEARGVFERALAVGPERAAYRKGLAAIFERSGEPKRAEQEWLRARELDASDVETLQALLRLALANGNVESEARWRAEIKAAEEP